MEINEFAEKVNEKIADVLGDKDEWVIGYHDIVCYNLMKLVHGREDAVSAAVITTIASIAFIKSQVKNDISKLLEDALSHLEVVKSDDE